MKAILVIDMPENCLDCPYSFNTQSIRCGLMISKGLRKTPKWLCYHKKDCKFDIENERHPDCPLRPLPQINEKRINFLRDCGWGIWDIERYAVGHGDCIDEILGDKNEQNNQIKNYKPIR